jgi:aldose 1-epimerase
VSDRQIDPVAPSGRQLELTAGDYRAVVVEVGASLRILEYQGQSVLDGYRTEEVCEGARGQLLVPWPNRVKDGRYEFLAETQQLDLSEPERQCAIHGLVRWVAWQIAEQHPDRVTLTYRLHAHPGYPHGLDLCMRYRLDRESGIEMALTAVNVGNTCAPYGLGMHPYLTVGTDTIDVCALEIPAERWLPTDDRGIPSGASEPVAGTPLDFRVSSLIGQTAIDFAFTELHRDSQGRATVTLLDPLSGRASSLWVDRSFPWIEVFTGDHLASRQRQGLGTEPMTCPPNALASGLDLIVLEPGASHTAKWGITAELRS